MSRFIENTLDGAIFNVDHIIGVQPDQGVASGFIALVIGDYTVEVNEDFYLQCKNIHTKPLLVEQKSVYVNTGPR